MGPKNKMYLDRWRRASVHLRKRGNARLGFVDPFTLPFMIIRPSVRLSQPVYRDWLVGSPVGGLLSEVLYPLKPPAIENKENLRIEDYAARVSICAYIGVGMYGYRAGHKRASNRRFRLINITQYLIRSPDVLALAKHPWLSEGGGGCLDFPVS